MAVLSFDGAGAAPLSIMLERWQHNLGDTTEAFAAMAEYQVKTVNKRQFDEQGTAETGGRWAPLSPRYARFKARVRPGRPLLVFDGDLRREMTVPGKGVYEIRNGGMTVGTDLPHATYHQNGTPNMPARPLLGKPRKQDTRQFGKILQRWIIESRPVA
jgi:phage gpG-like protein